MDEVLVADDLRKSYGDVEALSGVSLSVAEGEVFGLIGPNGAGKTTLVRALTGTTTVDSGSASILGGDPTAVDRQRLGLLPQDFTPAGRLTARELVAYYAGLYDDARNPDAVLDEVGLADAADTWYENLSGGQQRRACIALTLVNDPDVLFLDEPTTGIDPAGRRSLWALVEDLANSGTTVFLTSHSMEEVEQLADRVGLLNEGELVTVGRPDQLVSEYGGESRLVVRTAGGTDLDSVTLSPALRTEMTEDGVTVYGVGPREIGDAVAAFDDAGVVYESLVWKQPGLEEVYLSLTGEQFEAARPAAAAAIGGEQ
ncbi:ABC transporter ATP-binding protein [Haloferax mediterranei ATCC 33500]|uniref:ABC transporter ATP-binding protein n=1 Tax=Haloferax mediterranei (strain ATCC 33500 / DSM 1411 / JCM 8866 / NBRC 14739 / NCIMB 2177 / R-4) TaxID=523841 RepID=I3R3B0_HALMT|nr:ABC transporter ATP-binding protein [Haloferax mediterranei]AFK18720.1 ABC-type transport system ATP-binding protein [Haloferax mediterranei ATCC 33500]AHZ21912.1 ABC transporter ATP-binding protein [Haloferax mediterranei ATCC 33500]EMA03420.1 ABC-type transport system ATP-binding protein [Haloferax mediterranei ATCC 33500]MDX5988816.1 ABC transporter ATP-binding protein [Haloferax mediterranei ATCC 33500]QCQ75219.1 ABC transporter ATP-binding protein [Haloferax mediterranei ATCC 33500]